jgi:hypothetical protein
MDVRRADEDMVSARREFTEQWEQSQRKRL